MLADMIDKLAMAAPNSREAILKMKESLHLLKKNFSKYYTNMATSRGGMASFMVEFMDDVYKSVRDDMKEQHDNAKRTGKKGPSRAKLLSQFASLSKAIQ